MPRSRFYRLVPALLLIAACSDPGPVAPSIPRTPSFATSCSLGMSDADANATLEGLRTTINALEASGALTSGQANALRKHIDNIQKSIASGNYCAAVSQLNAFKEQVATFVTEGVLTPGQAAPLTGGADDVLQGAYYVSFMSDRSSNFEIYLARADGSGTTNLTNNPAWDAHGRWSPDGTKMVFASNREGTFKIWLANGDGSGQTRVTNTADGDGNMTWSPDGKHVVFVRNKTVRELWVMDADGSNQRKVVNGDWPAWSPDGTRLVYSDYRNDNFDIYVINLDGTGELRLTTDAAFDGYPTWSRDGSMIAWRTQRHTNTEIYTIKPDGSGIRRLTTTSVFNHPLDWSLDSKVLLTNRCNGTMCQLYAIQTDGSGETNLSNDGALDEYDGYFSPDGKRILFNRTRTESPSTRDVYVMNADGTGKTNITNSASENFSVTWVKR